MKIIVAIFPLLFLFSNPGLTQIDQEPPILEMRKVMFENQYFVMGKPVARREIVRMMRSFDEARKEMRAGIRWRALAHTHAALGSSVMLLAIVSLGSPGIHSILIAGVGFGIFWPAIPFSTKGDAKIYAAIDRYNLRQSELKKEVRMSLGFSLDQNGIGLKLKF